MTAVTTAASAAAARIGAVLSDAQYFESSMVRVEDIRRQLDSRSVKDKLDAMKRVVALISLGKDASTFFPDVVKNVVAPSLEVKKLVYLYLVHYAEEKQDLALLAINTFQRDLSDHNQHIRALSLRVLSSIRVKVILQVVILAINNAAKDSSSYVRKAAALAIGKVCALDSASKEILMDPLKDLLCDRSTQVMGSAVAAFEEVCPYEFTLIHPHYRRMCTGLVDVEPWGQIGIINLLLRYARIHFADPNSAVPSHSDDAYGVRAGKASRNPDLILLLESVSPLFYSLNNSVIASVIAVYYHLATEEEFCTQAIKPLMRLVAIEDDGGQAVALNIAAAVAARYPGVLIPYVTEFFVSAGHSAPIRSLRMLVLNNICAAGGAKGGIGSKPHARRAVLAELKEYLFRTDNELAAASARAFGCLATAHPNSTPAIVKVLSSVVGSAKNPAVVSESITVLRRLLQRHPSAQAKALPQLIAMLLATKESERESIQEPAARASIIWLIGEFYVKVQAVATEALRLLARGFNREEAEVKLQILNLAAKVVASNECGKDTESLVDDFHAAVDPNEIRMKLLEYVITCAKYDRDYDVRDKARMLQFLFLSQSKTALFKAACSAFLSRKPAPLSGDNRSDPNKGRDDDLAADVVVGSFVHVLGGRRLPGFRPLDPWAKTDSDAAIRDDVDGQSNGASINRDYTGVGSVDYHGSISNDHVSSTVWQPPSAISSETPGRINAFQSEGTSGFSRSFFPTSQCGNANVDYSKVDPEQFYNSDGDDESSEYDSSSEDDVDSDAEEAGGDIMEAASVQKRSSLLGLDSGDLISTVQHDESNKAQASGMRKPNFDYDLDALLGNLDVSTSSRTAENRAVGSGSRKTVETQSRWHRVLDSWNAGGCEVNASFVRTGSAAGPEVTPVILQVVNRGKSDFKNISFSSRAGDCFASQGSIVRLAQNAEEEVRVDVRFRGKTSGVRFEVLIEDVSVGVGEFKPSIGYIIRPYPSMTVGDFLKAEKSLSGMFGSNCTIPLSEPMGSDWIGLSACIQERLTEVCFVSHVKTSVGGVDASDRFSALFAGYLPATQVSSREKRPVLIRSSVQSGGEKGSCSCHLWIGCEDVLFSANLMQVCKAALHAIDGKPL